MSTPEPALPVRVDRPQAERVEGMVEVLYACDEFLGNVTEWDGTDPDELAELRLALRAVLASDGGDDQEATDG